MNIIKEILREFTSVFYSKNVGSITKDVSSEILGINEGSSNGKYLGLPSLVGKRKNEILGFIKNKVIGRINSWNNKYLSKVGREVLIKNVLQAMSAYAMSTFLLPQELCNKIEVTMNG